ncbi:hypothetical protein ERJ75_001026500 [Trypanosoma vivax]|uniref:Transmembrane protein n=1 Tax=Trypanosoma vivax (strain Y486) TaxID=1055687 RepID=G0TR41_TRYVY|nr:hypothetical protein TRVL_01626 [Trypanosoma vivax]KAH8611391.1 hypothetical protein ERJ75_001026500 [Trypanosoma vivax]CCC46405.1 conserved hypothetical protein [Trypanosoma vivax Y486]
MIQVVPDDYFPSEDTEAPNHRSTSEGLSSNGGAAGAFSPFRFSFYGDIPLPVVETTCNETLLDIVGTATQLMQTGDLEAACRLVEQSGLLFDNVIVNVTHIATAVNAVLGVVVHPISYALHKFVRYYAVEVTNTTEPGTPWKTGENATIFGGEGFNYRNGISSSYTSSGSVLSMFIELCSLNALFYDTDFRSCLRTVLFVLCLCLCIFIVIIRLWARKYTCSIDALALQQRSGSDICGDDVDHFSLSPAASRRCDVATECASDSQLHESLSSSPLQQTLMWREHGSGAAHTELNSDSSVSCI